MSCFILSLQGRNHENNSFGNLLPDVQSAYSNHKVKDQYSEVKGHHYESFKTGYYDGYVMARQDGGGGGEKKVEEMFWPRNLMKVLALSFIFGMLVLPQLLKTLGE